MSAEANSPLHPIQSLTALTKFVETQIRGGESKRELYQRLKARYPKPDRLARVIAMFPSNEQRARYGLLSKFVALAAAVSIVAGAYYLSLVFADLSLFERIFNSVAVVLQLMFLANAFKLLGPSFPFLTQLCAIRLLVNFPGFEMFEFRDSFRVELQLLLAIDFLAAAGCAFIWWKVFPYYGLSSPRRGDDEDLQVHAAESK
ncbi:MAG: hypothetical protein NXI24_10890 [bacterium]|nr:hypothetical protein [bacterium]